MRIANVIRRFSMDEWGGPEKVVLNTLRELKLAGHDPEILCTSAMSHSGETEINGIRIRRFDYSYLRFPLSSSASHELDRNGGNPGAPQLWKALHEGGYDLIHCHSAGRLGAGALKSARELKIPFVISLHSGPDPIESERHSITKPRSWTVNYGKFYDWRHDLDFDPLAMADGVICISGERFEQIRKMYPAQKVLYMPKGVSPDEFAVRSRFLFRSFYGIPREQKMILCVSRIEPQKNQMLLLRLLRELVDRGSDVHLVIIGPVHSEIYHSELNAYINENKLGLRVKLIPGIAPDDPALIAAYQEADIFILPSFEEPFGIVVLEAWASGLPVIAASTGGIRHLLKDRINGLVFDPKSLDSLVKAFATLENEPELQLEIKNNESREIRENYSWHALTGRLLEFYKEVAYAVR